MSDEDKRLVLELLMYLASAMADVAGAVKHFVDETQGMTPEEVAGLTTQLRAAAEKINDIANPPSP